MTKEELAAELNGYGREMGISRKLQKSAIDAGLVFVYAAGDDLLEMDGAIEDEGDVTHHSIVRVCREGIIHPWNPEDYYKEREAEGYFKNKARSLPIKVLQDTEVDGLATSWAYETDIPHSTFHIVEDDDLYCIGIVFDIKDLPA